MWAIEHVYRNAIFYLYGSSYHVLKDRGDTLSYVVHIMYGLLCATTYGLFVSTMFRLKSFEIYLDSDNSTKADVKSDLSRLQCLRNIFATLLGFMTMISVPIYLNGLWDNKYFMDRMEKLSVGFLVIMIAFKACELFCTLYFLKMTLNMQNIFREAGHITSYKNEVFLICCIFLYWAMQMLPVARVVFVWLINTRDFRCNKRE